MIADQWCRTSWRATSGSFVGLMTLYESNFVRLGWIVRDLRTLAASRTSRVAADCDLHLMPVENSRYTTVFRLTYLFDLQGAVLKDPDLEICVYHDARLAEVRSLRGGHHHPQLAHLHDRLDRELDRRWARNMMLNKWLEYCAERGHRF